MFEVELAATGAEGGLTVRLTERSSVVGVAPPAAGPVPRTCRVTGLQSVPGCVQLKLFDPGVNEYPLAGEVAGTCCSVERMVLPATTIFWTANAFVAPKLMVSD